MPLFKRPTVSVPETPGNILLVRGAFSNKSPDLSNLENRFDCDFRLIDRTPDCIPSMVADTEQRTAAANTRTRAITADVRGNRWA